MRGVAGFERGLACARVASLFRLRLQRLFRRAGLGQLGLRGIPLGITLAQLRLGARKRDSAASSCVPATARLSRMSFPRRQRQGMLAQAFGFVGIGLPLRRQFGLRVALGGGLFRARQLQRGVPYAPPPARPDRARLPWLAKARGSRMRAPSALNQVSR